MRKLILLLLVLSVSAALAGPVVYTDYSAWLAATPGDHDKFGPPENLGDLAVTTGTGSFGAPRGVFPTGTNVWNDRVTLDLGEATTFYDGDADANIPYYAFGGFWDFSPGGYGQGLILTLNNGQSFQICGDPIGCVPNARLVPDGTFFGVVTNGFTSLTITAGTDPGGCLGFGVA